MGSIRVRFVCFKFRVWFVIDVCVFFGGGLFGLCVCFMWVLCVFKLGIILAYILVLFGFDVGFILGSMFGFYFGVLFRFGLASVWV